MMKKIVFFVATVLITIATSAQKLDMLWSHDMSAVGGAVRNIALVSGTEVAATNLSFSGGADNVIFFDANGQTAKTHDVAKFLNDNQVGTTGEDGVFSAYGLGRGIDVDAVGNIVVNLGFPYATESTDFVVIASDGTMRHIHCEVPVPGETSRADFIGVAGDLNKNGYLVMAMNQKNYVAVYNIFYGEQDIDYSYLVNADEGTIFSNETKVVFPVKTVVEDAENAPEFFVYHRGVAGVRYSDGASALTVLSGENFQQGNAVAVGLAAFQVDGVNYIVMPTPDDTGSRNSWFKVVNVATDEVVAVAEGVGGNSYSQDYSAWVNEDGTVSIAQLNQGKALTMYKLTLGESVEETVFANSLTIDSERILEVGESSVISATILPENVTNPTLTWTSSDENVATVSNGEVLAISAGTAIITATTTDGSNLTATCNVTVKDAEAIVPTPNITNVWECDAHSIFSSDNYRSATGYGNKIYVSNVANGCVEEWENGVMIDSYDVNSFMISQGEKYESSGILRYYNLWTAITTDDAGNILVNAGAFADEAKGTKWVYIPANNRKDMQVLTLEMPENVIAGRVDYVGRMVGDIASENGAAFIMAPKGSSYAAIFNLYIENGKISVNNERSLAVPSSTEFSSDVVFAILARYEDIMNAKTVEELGQTLYCKWRTSKTIYRWDGTKMSPCLDSNGLVIGSDGCAAAGLDVFKIGETKYYVVPFMNGYSANGRTTSFEIRNLETGAVVASYNTQCTNDNYMSSYVARVNEDGVTATIYAYNQKDKIGLYTFDSGEVIEKDVLVESLTIDEMITLDEGETAVISATIMPEDVTNSELIWKSSDENVATVSNGEVVAVSAGTALIIASTTDGTELSDTCVVTVNKVEVIVPEVGGFAKVWSHDISSLGSAVRKAVCVGDQIVVNDMSFSGGSGKVLFYDATGRLTKEYDVDSWLAEQQIGTTNESGEFTPYTLGCGIDVDAVGNIVVNLGFPNSTSAANFVAIAPDGTMKYIHCENLNEEDLARADFIGVAGDIFSNGYIALTAQNRASVSVYNIWEGQHDFDYSYVVNADEGTTFSCETKVVFPVKTVAEDAEYAPEFYVYQRSVAGVRYSDGAVDGTLTVMTGDNFLQGKASCTGIAAFQVNGVNYIVMPTPDESGARANAFKIVNVATGNVVVTCQGATEYGTNYAQDYSAWVNEDGTVNIVQFVQGKYMAMYKFNPNGDVAEPVLAESLTIDEAINIEVGKSAVITATISPEIVSNKALTWTSSDENVATVSNGEVVAVSAGTAIITATTTDGTNLTATCVVTVNKVEYTVDYGFVVEDIETMDNSLNVPVSLVNVGEVSAFQFDLYLPEGITLPMNDDEYEIIMDSNRATSSHVTSSYKHEDGKIRFTCYSTKSLPLNGESGSVLFTLPLSISDDLEGAYNIEIKNIILSSSVAESHKCEDIVSTIIVKYRLGDSNGDRNVNIIDVVNTMNIVLGKGSSRFIQSAGDINSDGRIDIVDVVATMNIVLDSEITASTETSKLSPMSVKTIAQESVYMNDFTICASESKIIDVNLMNKVAYSAIQFDIHMPTGLSIDYNEALDECLLEGTSRLSGSHVVSSKQLAEGVIRVGIYSTKNSNIALTEGSILRIPFIASSDMPLGDYEISIKNIVLSTSESEGAYLSDTVTMMKAQASSTTGISDIQENGSDVEYYNLQGVKVSKENLQRGVYIKKQGEKASKITIN